MPNSDPEIQKAKNTIRLYFTDNYGRPLRKPYYVTQPQTLLEDLHFPWIIYQAASRFVEEECLSRIETAQSQWDASFTSLNDSLIAWRMISISSEL